jgi:hypothetical protein
LSDYVNKSIVEYSERELFFMYDIICFLLEKYRVTGILRAFSKQELLEVFPLKKTQLQVYLKKAKNENIVFYYYRKYLLNLEHHLVKKLWNYFFTPKELKDNLIEDFMRIKNLNGEKCNLEEEINSISTKMVKCYRMINYKEIRIFGKELQQILLDLGFDKESFFNLCKDNLTLIVGFV